MAMTGSGSARLTVVLEGANLWPSRGAVQLAARAQRRGEELSLVLIDLDGFKQVNDSLGHPEGDRLLRRVGSILRNEVRRGEVCGRIGGDEFAVALTGGFVEATNARDRLVTALCQAGISATGGLATSGPAGRLRRLYADADAQLLAAKRRRVNRRASPVSLPSTKEVVSNSQPGHE